jgi:hypothetical protein
MTLPVVIIPLFDRPLRASIHRREIRSEQLRTLADTVQKHLHELVPIVDILKHAGWEVLADETSLVCRHPSVRTNAQAQVALCQLGIEAQWYRLGDPMEVEQPVANGAANGRDSFPPRGGTIGCKGVPSPKAEWDRRDQVRLQS